MQRPRDVQVRDCDLHSTHNTQKCTSNIDSHTHPYGQCEQHMMRDFKPSALHHKREHFLWRMLGLGAISVEIACWESKAKSSNSSLAQLALFLSIHQKKFSTQRPSQSKPTKNDDSTHSLIFASDWIRRFAFEWNQIL